MIVRVGLKVITAVAISTDYIYTTVNPNDFYGYLLNYCIYFPVIHYTCMMKLFVAEPKKYVAKGHCDVAMNREAF